MNLMLLAAIEAAAVTCSSVPFSSMTRTFVLCDESGTPAQWCYLRLPAIIVIDVLAVHYSQHSIEVM